MRAENLRFREEGVKEVLARVLLPLLNSFRFFVGQVALLERDTGIRFEWTEHAAISSNIMDRWILARCQSLIKLVREEMEGMSCAEVATINLISVRASVPTLHRHSTVTASCRRAYELVYPIQQISTQG